MSLTEKQMRAKMKAEAAGQVFLPPNQYKAMMKDRAKPKYTKKAVRTNPQQVASYTAKKAFKSEYKEISPDTELLIDQCLNPEDVNESTRWPNTYGLSATYKCKTILNAKFSDENRCCVAVNPTVRDSIFTTAGSSGQQQLNKYDTNGAANPFSLQDIILASTNTVVSWSAPIILESRQALIPFPNSQTAQLLYPIGFSYQANTNINNIALNMRFPAALSDQAQVRVTYYSSSYTNVYDSGYISITNQGSPSGMGITNLGLGNAIVPTVAYMAVQIRGTILPYTGPVYLYFTYDPATGPTTLGYLDYPNHAQHVTIHDIRDADTIVDSATQAFVLAQSLLITAEMSDLNNGGVLSIARVPGATVIGEGDDEVDFNSWYEWIASLPYNAYDGAVKNGGYCWYLPEDETGFFYRPLDTYFGKELPYMVSEFTVSDNTEASVVRIKVSTIVQFTTTSSIYDCRPSCYVSEMAFMHHILSLVQAAYSNDGHKAGLKAGLKKVAASVVKLLKNPKTYATAGGILKAIAPAIALLI